MVPTVYALTPKMQVFDDTGYFGVGWKLYTYEAGTSTPADTYTDSTGNSANTNPVIADSRGEFDLWFDATKYYKLVLKDANDVTKWTVDNFGIINISDSLAEAIRTQEVNFVITDVDVPIATSQSEYTWYPRFAGTFLSAHASVKTTSADAMTFDIKINGTSIFSTTITIDGGEHTSLTAATAPVINTSADDFAAGDAVTFHITDDGDGNAVLAQIMGQVQKVV